MDIGHALTIVMIQGICEAAGGMTMLGVMYALARHLRDDEERAGVLADWKDDDPNAPTSDNRIGRG